MKNQKELIFFRYRLLWHLLFWSFWYLFFVITYNPRLNYDTSQWLLNLCYLPARMAGVYTFIYCIIPFSQIKKKYFLFAGLIIIHAILYGIAINFTLSFFRDNPVTILGFIRPFLLNYQVPISAIAIVFFKRYYKVQQYTLNLERERLEAELKYLKAQIHPHFLFNTLNNLYSLTIKKSDKAPDVVLQLSDMLDYILHSEEKNNVYLFDEVNQLKGYIDLEKIRYGKRLQIKFDIFGDLGNKLITPLILLPFVENSFKHGASRDTKSPFIEIMIEIKELSLLFNIRNSYVSEEKGKDDYMKGIGLKNVIRRIELLYPDKHKLEIINDGKYFDVRLNLELIEDK